MARLRITSLQYHYSIFSSQEKWGNKDLLPKLHELNWSKIVYMLRRLGFNLAYYQRPPWDTGISPPELLDYIATHPPGRALELGCGTGTNTVTLAKAGWKVTAVDFARKAIRLAKRKAQQNGVEIDFHQDDVTHLDCLTGSFDLILDIGCFHSLPINKRAKYIANLACLLSSTGTYLLYAFFKQHADSIGPGITEDDFMALSKELDLVQRMDSTERGFRPSAWIVFRRHE